MHTTCRVLLIGGSLRAGSTNTAVLRAAQAVAPETRSALPCAATQFAENAHGTGRKTGSRMTVWGAIASPATGETLPPVQPEAQLLYLESLVETMPPSSRPPTGLVVWSRRRRPTGCGGSSAWRTRS